MVFSGRHELPASERSPPSRTRTRQAEQLRWFVPPRLRTTDRLEERRASWLELFFDLVFVVAITQLSHELVVDHSLAGFLKFAGLFVPVFVAWQGFSFYADRFDTDDLACRAVFGAGMLAIIALAGLIDDVGHGERTAGFALAYVGAPLADALAVRPGLVRGARGAAADPAVRRRLQPSAWPSGCSRSRSTPRRATSSGASP